MDQRMGVAPGPTLSASVGRAVRVPLARTIVASSVVCLLPVFLIVGAMFARNAAFSERVRKSGFKIETFMWVFPLMWGVWMAVAQSASSSSLFGMNYYAKMAVAGLLFGVVVAFWMASKHPGLGRTLFGLPRRPNKKKAFYEGDLYMLLAVLGAVSGLATGLVSTFMNVAG